MQSYFFTALELFGDIVEFLLGVILDLGGLLRPDGLAIVEVIRWVMFSQKSVPSSPKKESSKFSLSIFGILLLPGGLVVKFEVEGVEEISALVRFLFIISYSCCFCLAFFNRISFSTSLGVESLLAWESISFPTNCLLEMGFEAKVFFNAFFLSLITERSLCISEVSKLLGVFALFATKLM